MSAPQDYIADKYQPQLARGLKQAIACRIAQQFPRIGGPRITDLCAEMILEVFNTHVRTLDCVTHGRVLWMAISAEHPPSRYQPEGEKQLVPVLLDLSTPEDIQTRLDRMPAQQRLLQRAIRLCQQAYEQGGLLSNVDLAELLSHSDAHLAHLLSEHERQTDQVVPRRATLHDAGSGLTHKRIICRKHYVEGKTSDIIARETYHSLTAVDNYLAEYQRVRQLQNAGMTPEQMAHILQCSLRLVKEYLAIDDELSGGAVNSYGVHGRPIDPDT